MKRLIVAVSAGSLSIAALAGRGEGALRSGTEDGRGPGARLRY
jgi:hypothetical protein